MSFVSKPKRDLYLEQKKLEVNRTPSRLKVLTRSVSPEGRVPTAKSCSCSLGLSSSFPRTDLWSPVPPVSVRDLPFSWNIDGRVTTPAGSGGSESVGEWGSPDADWFPVDMTVNAV